MKEYVTRETSGAVPDLTPSSGRVAGDEAGGGVLAHLGISAGGDGGDDDDDDDDDAELGPLDGDGAAFYEAYRRAGSRGSASPDAGRAEDAELTVRMDGARRVGGRGVGGRRPGRRKKRMGVDRASLRSTAVRRLVRPAVGRRRGRGGTNGPYGRDGESWTHPQKRRRTVYGAMAVVIVAVGLCLVVASRTARPRPPAWTAAKSPWP